MTSSAAAILLKLASVVSMEKLRGDLTTGRLGSAIAALSGAELEETARALEKRRDHLERSGDMDSVRIVELIYDRVVDEWRRVRRPA